MQWAQGFALSAGGPGLFLIGFLDSSVLSFPGVNDLLLVWMVIAHKDLMLFYAAMATAGSVAGCLVIYYLGRFGADAFLRRRFGHARIARAERVVARFGFFAVLIPAILPPPAPFKIFILLAGVGAMPLRTFIAAVGIGRGLRYVVEGLLAIAYGDRAVGYIEGHGLAVALLTCGALLGVGVAWMLVRRRRDRVGRTTT
jgi:membrane protein YqaA with SNARE-associated domain